MKTWLAGGVHTDFTFEKVKFGTEEFYVFESYEELIIKWKERMWANVDNALYNLKIYKEQPTLILV